MLLMEGWYYNLNFSFCALTPIDVHVPCCPEPTTLVHFVLVTVGQRCLQAARL